MGGAAYAQAMTFGARLKTARTAKGLTQEELGRGLSTDGKDASKSVVYGWEKDQHYPRTDQLEMICKKLGCSADYLLFGIESQAVFSTEAAQIARQFDEVEGEDRKQLFTLWQEMSRFVRRRSEPPSEGGRKTNKGMG